MARVGGASLDAVAKQFGVSRDSVFRHFKSHVSDKRRVELMAGPAAMADLANRAAAESKSLLEQLQILRSVFFRQFLNAAEAGDRPGVANVGGRLLEALRELGRLTGELREISGLTINATQINIVASPEFILLQEGLLKIARAHPDARSPIVELLEGLAARPPLARHHGALPLIEGEAIHA